MSTSNSFKLKRTASLFLALITACGILIGLPPISGGRVAAETAAAAEPVTFLTQAGGIYDGMPLFDGNPTHLDAFVDALYAYTGLEGGCLYATGIRDNYTLTTGPNAGKTIPGGLSAADNVQGVSTDFPAMVGLGQSWNKDLLAAVGDVMGSEKVSTLLATQGTSNIHNGSNSSKIIAFTAISDLRINPLSGRIDESLGEDALLVGELINNLAGGIIGVNDGLAGTTGVEDDGFYIRAVVGTKHFSNYAAQWYRTTSSNSAGARAIFEYQIRSALKGLASGNISGVMTSFGRTNGVPNIISSWLMHANDIAKYGMYSSPDFNGENNVYANNGMGNGYDTKYALDRKHTLALMVLANSESVRAMGTDKSDVITLMTAVNEGLYGIAAADVYEAGRPLVNQLVRAGVFDECDENGIPRFDPYAQYAKDVADPTTLTSYATAAHQDVALQAALESVILLKNDGTLPLDKTSSFSISGLYADARFKTTYAVGSTPPDSIVADSGITPLLATIRAVGDPDSQIDYSLGTKIIAIKASNGKYLTAASGTGAQLVADFEYDPADPAEQFTDAQLFEVFEWGQEAFSLRSVLNGLWVTSPGQANASVGNTNNTPLNLTNSDWDLATMSGSSSSIPPRLRLEDNGDGSFSIIANVYSTSFSASFTTQYYTGGRFIGIDADGKLLTAATVLTDAATAAVRSDTVKFMETVVKETGADAAATAAEDDAAIIYVGAIPRNSAGEGNDRSSLYMAEADYELINTVSAAFAAAGKKTVVVILSSFPVIAEQIQDNPNVNAVIYQPYAGQFGSKALVRILFGDDTPTGRLTSTWYASMDALPDLTTYSIPEGNTTPLDKIDPRFTKDMTDADPMESKLTYLYTDADVTYAFGYGLSYSTFTYGNLQASARVSSDEPFAVTIDVTNTGTVATSEVVQLYIKNSKSDYGSAAPIKQLVSFEKVFIEPGSTATVTLTINPQDFAVWDVNRGELVVEEGKYTLMAGASSDDIRQEKKIRVGGDELANLPCYQTFNVFDHSFIAKDVVYREVSKQNTVDSLQADEVVGGYYAVMSKASGSYVALSNVDLNWAQSLTARVASNDAGGRITFRLDSPTGKAIASLDVPVTEPVSYILANTSAQVNELGYVEVSADLSRTVCGVHDVYVVFEDDNIRLDTLTFAVPATIRGTNAIKRGAVDPAVTVVAAGPAFSDDASDTANWSILAGMTGLKLDSVTLNADKTEATLIFVGIARQGAMLIKARQSAFGSGASRGSNQLVYAISRVGTVSGGMSWAISD